MDGTLTQNECDSRFVAGQRGVRYAYPWSRQMGQKGCQDTFFRQWVEHVTNKGCFSQGGTCDYGGCALHFSRTTTSSTEGTGPVVCM